MSTPVVATRHARSTRIVWQLARTPNMVRTRSYQFYHKKKFNFDVVIVGDDCHYAPYHILDVEPVHERACKQITIG